MKKPCAVLISDVHFTPQTLDIATAAYTQALDKAYELGVPFYDLGDTTDTKAILRAEVVNRLIEIFGRQKYVTVETHVVVGNHSLINNKSSEDSLHFLNGLTNVVRTPETHITDLGTKMWVFPYSHDLEATRKALAALPPGGIVLMHQGFKGANMGHYLADQDALDVSDVAHLRVITGHYHRRQDIGTVSYVGNPYTLTFGEASDPEKGFRVLYEDGSLDFIPTKLPKHVILTLRAGEYTATSLKPGDKVWVRVHGTRSELATVTKDDVAKALGLKDFKFDKLIDMEEAMDTAVTRPATSEEAMDAIIDSIADTDVYKATLKALWREIV